MEKLSQQVVDKKQAFNKIDLKHQNRWKGKFSSAFLPSAFGSPHKYT